MAVVTGLAAAAAAGAGLIVGAAQASSSDQRPPTEDDKVKAANLGVEWDDEDGYGYSSAPPEVVPGTSDGPTNIHVELHVTEDE
ncbi:hypothetical protein [Cellulomonas sp. URHB0016]